MRKIKLSGRERAVLKAVGFAEAVSGAQVMEHSHIQPDDLTDVLNALLAAGYIESKPVLRASQRGGDADDRV